MNPCYNFSASIVYRQNASLLTNRITVLLMLFMYCRLHSIIAHNMVKSDTHCAFIDFSKAFDKIDRLILYNKMMKCGISSMMLQMIVNMYSKIRSKIKTSEEFTDAFPLDIGPLQGECVSPSLFSMCIDDIVAHMHTVNKMGVCVNGTVLKYADDLVPEYC